MTPMSRSLAAAWAACACLALAPPAAHAGLFGGDGGYPDDGRAIDQLKPAPDYTDMVKNRPLALGIMRTRAQGFVPSPELHAYVGGVMAKLLRGVAMPASFDPEVHILAAPEFAGECTPDGTLIITVGLLEQLETEDELAFVIGHELSHAIYRHQSPDWYKKAQLYAVINGAAVDTIAQSAAARLSPSANANIGRALDVARHLEKLSDNVLMPQMERGQEDQADALGFDLMVKAGYDPDAALAVMDKLAEQEAEAAQAAADAKKAADSGDAQKSATSLFNNLETLGTGILTHNVTSGQIADVSIAVFDLGIDSMADDATSHHPAGERADLLSAYEFRAYRDARPVAPTPLPWSADSRSPLKPALTALLAHYTMAENAAAFVADASQGTTSSAAVDVSRSTAPPTRDHAYTEFVASEYYGGAGQQKRAEAALVVAAKGPEPSWEVYSRLIDVYSDAHQFPQAQATMDEAVSRFADSPVLFPKRITLYRAEGRQGDADALVVQCKAVGIDALSEACDKADQGS